MTKDIEIVIIYSDSDNLSTDLSDNGWVTDFKRFLELMLIQVLGEKPNILLKPGHDHVTGAKIESVSLLLPVLSESFIQSGECLDFIEEFHNQIGNDDPERIFKILKSPLTIEQQPNKLKSHIGYDLFYINPQSGEQEEYKDFFGPDAERNYWMKMVDLAYDLCESIVELKQKSSKSDKKSIFSRRSIYLAETSHDLSIQRNIIKRDLQRHGYKIYPDQTLSQDLNELKSQIKTDLENSDMSIHLIGSSYGEIPAGSEQSIVAIQNRLAAMKSKEFKNTNNFSRLIWVTPNLQNASEKQHTFIQNIKRDLSYTEGAEIMQTPLEDFKNIVKEELLEIGSNTKNLKDTSIDGEKQLIYLLHDKTDIKGIFEIEKAIREAGYEVLKPSFEGGLLDLRQHHISNLKKLDGAIIYQDNVNNQWVRMKLLDLLKAPGFGRNKKIKGKAIISKRKEKVDLDIFDNHQITLIDGNSNSVTSAIKSFLKDIR